MNLDSLWGDIAEEQFRTALSGIAVRRIDPESRDNIFIGYRQPEGTKLLILRVPHAPAVTRNALVQSRGFTTRVSRYQHDPEGSHSLVLEATDRPFNEVFTVLAGDIIRRVKDRKPEETPVSAFLGCLLQWKRFFDLSGHEGLSDELLLGLFAELTFLRDFALHHTGGIAAVAGWVGPDPLTKDFQYPGFSVEVKGTASAEPAKVRISSERQLDDNGIDRLLLFVLPTEKAAGSTGTTVPELVDSVRTELGDASSARLIFEEKLLSYGYHDIHRSKYQSRRFVKHGHRVFHVRTGFPRLTASLPPGVGDVTYSLTLSACIPFTITDSELTGLFSTIQPYDA